VVIAATGNIFPLHSDAAVILTLILEVIVSTRTILNL